MNQDVKNLFGIAALIAGWAVVKWVSDEMQNADLSLKESPLMRFAMARRDAMVAEEFKQPEEEAVDGSD